MINIQNKKDCTGCYSCENICPLNAINMEIDEEGFWYPKVLKDKCINCGLCEQSCPIINKKEITSLKKAYASFNKNDEIRIKSSSGGIFSVIATDIIKNNGVVYGAAFDENFDVVHICVENKSQLYKLRGSKYVQSNLNNTYKQIKEKLLEGKQVLFSGTPCQVSGLKSFLGKDYDNLFCIDLICHGVPSPKVWKKYIQEISNGKRISDFTFRDKSDGWKESNLVCKFENGREYREKYQDNKYIKGFIKNCFLRPSCYSCNNKTLNRCSDLTLADFWGIENILPNLDCSKGISLILVHTDKGLKKIKALNDEIYLKEVDIDCAIKDNSCAVESVKLTKARKKFFDYVNNMSVNESIDKSLNKNIIELMFEKLKLIMLKIKRKLKYKGEEVYYSTTDYILKNFLKLNIKTIDESIEYLINNRVSVARFGDGEFKIINSDKIGFQEVNSELSRRLKEVLKSNSNDIMICLPGTLISTDDMIEKSKRYWDEHLKRNRLKWYKHLTLNKVYYNTQMTRLYIDYKDKSCAGERFNKFKRLWNERDLVIIEGEHSKLGVGNDLFENANSISRIIAPSKNAFNKYDEILNFAKTLDKDKLILIALGPTATVLAYDLHLLGYQAIDVGHIDIEYEWFLRKVDKKIAIENKYVNEVIEGRVAETKNDEKYLNQIIYKID